MPIYPILLLCVHAEYCSLTDLQLEAQMRGRQEVRSQSSIAILRSRNYLARSLRAAAPLNSSFPILALNDTTLLRQSQPTQNTNENEQKCVPNPRVAEPLSIRVPQKNSIPSLRVHLAKETSPPVYQLEIFKLFDGEAAMDLVLCCSCANRSKMFVI